MTDFGLTESDLSSAARTSMPGDAIQCPVSLSTDSQLSRILATPAAINTSSKATQLAQYAASGCQTAFVALIIMAHSHARVHAAIIKHADAGMLPDFLWHAPSHDVPHLDVLPLPCNSSMMLPPSAFAAGPAPVPLVSTVIAMPNYCRLPHIKEQVCYQHPSPAQGKDADLGTHSIQVAFSNTAAQC